ncbi:hypothetical protein SAMN05421856_101386 [Chryseobacterium taichungense]|uniref:Uncharacterized protein n=1 Tax=Chryseobacterium taichungense TaxID=295069 RepID=A0A1H7W0U5_9FLAO|nr:hypothetical protein [Chryseobacterium taichungense]SEM14685.1 hypothetical protein SAMN05421856_101386 [Chryseobacterium taichungense]
MENQLREKIIENALKTLDQLKFQYENTEDELEHMKKGLYLEKGKMYDGKVWESYTTTVYHNVFDIPKAYYCIIDAETLQLKGIMEDLGVQEIIYDKEGKATGTKFISPSFPYDKQ